MSELRVIDNPAASDIPALDAEIYALNVEATGIADGCFDRLKVGPLT